LEELAQKDTELARTRAELDSVQELLKEVEAKQIQKEDYENRQSLLNQKLKLQNVEELRKEQAALRERKKAFDEKQQLLKVVEELSTQQNVLTERITTSASEILAFEKELEDIKILFESVKDVEDQYSGLRKELEELQGSEKDLLVKKASLDTEAENAEKNLAEMTEEIIKMLKIREQIQSTRELQEWLDNIFVKLMETMESLVMKRVYGEFNEYFQTWFKMLLEDENLSVRLDDEFSPIIEQNGYETTISNLSGGEKTSCALAYRLALNRTINDMISGIKTKDLIILDEPTDGFSNEQLEKVRDVINELNIAQVILVSHEPKIESFVDNVIKVQKEEHSSSVA